MIFKGIPERAYPMRHINKPDKLLNNRSVYSTVMLRLHTTNDLLLELTLGSLPLEEIRNPIGADPYAPIHIACGNPDLSRSSNGICVTNCSGKGSTKRLLAILWGYRLSPK